MSIFDNLAVISFLLTVFFIFFSNFLYKKLTICVEDLQELKRFKEETFNFIKNLEASSFKNHSVIDFETKKPRNSKG